MNQDDEISQRLDSLRSEVKLLARCILQSYSSSIGIEPSNIIKLRELISGIPSDFLMFNQHIAYLYNGHAVHQVWGNPDYPKLWVMVSHVPSSGLWCYIIIDNEVIVSTTLSAFEPNDNIVTANTRTYLQEKAKKKING